MMGAAFFVGKNELLSWLNALLTLNYTNRLVGSLQLYVSFGKEPYKRDDILQKRPIILKSLIIVATP